MLAHRQSDDDLLLVAYQRQLETEKDRAPTPFAPETKLIGSPSTPGSEPWFRRSWDKVRAIPRRGPLRS